MKKHLDTLVVSMRILLISLLLILLLTIGFCISCQSQNPAAPATSPELPEEPIPGTQPTTLQIEVVIEGFVFKPMEVNAPVGSTITWYNRDSVIHTVTARDKTFDSGSLSRGGTFSHKFEEKGVFEYYCIPHPYMTGKVIIE